MEDFILIIWINSLMELLTSLNGLWTSFIIKNLKLIERSWICGFRTQMKSFKKLNRNWLNMNKCIKLPKFKSKRKLKLKKQWWLQKIIYLKPNLKKFLLAWEKEFAKSLTRELPGKLNKKCKHLEKKLKEISKIRDNLTMSTLPTTKQSIKRT